MNQIIIIGEVLKVKEIKTHLTVEIKTKDYQKNPLNLKILVEPGYQKEMIEVLLKLPLIAVKCGLRLKNQELEFIAEKMSVLKLSEEESKDS